MSCDAEIIPFLAFLRPHHITMNFID